MPTLHSDTGLALERFLREVHDRVQGLTPDALAHLPVQAVADDGTTRTLASTYDALAEALLQGLPTDPAGARVLDLACGDGHLLRTLARHAAGTHGTHGTAGTELHGVDLSFGELRAARSRSGPTTHWVQARAQQLPYPDAEACGGHGFDAVGCHMALMLMDPVEPVLAEVWRVLRPGGRFVALVALPSPSPALDVLLDQLRAHPRRSEWQGLRFPGGWTHRAETVAARFAGWDALECLSLRCEPMATPAELWAWCGGFYELQALTAEQRRALEAGFLAETQRRAGDAGRLPLPLQFLRIVARKPAEGRGPSARAPVAPHHN